MTRRTSCLDQTHHQHHREMILSPLVFKLSLSVSLILGGQESSCSAFRLLPPAHTLGHSRLARNLLPLVTLRSNFRVIGTAVSTPPSDLPLGRSASGDTLSLPRSPHSLSRAHK